RVARPRESNSRANSSLKGRFSRTCNFCAVSIGTRFAQDFPGKIALDKVSRAPASFRSEATRSVRLIRLKLIQSFGSKRSATYREEDPVASFLTFPGGLRYGSIRTKPPANARCHPRMAPGRADLYGSDCVGQGSDCRVRALLRQIVPV